MDALRDAPGVRSIAPGPRHSGIFKDLHHRISELLAAGVSPALVARQVGHTSLQQLKTDAHLEVADVAAVLSRLEPVQSLSATGAR